ncbi:hypothetical protein [Cystobacter ferrugineus]|uniref:Uncharacterized protein n=1 Tax=Cystobacter ferrugineus TaxID=83449 RepID=A0A1L9B2X4_9BACT|nr:hypothetical protein [Cystobacter ferrugineus]OJH36621.1 hypothetical protein BON30_33235 [Cystobacter ferrugineus]
MAVKNRRGKSQLPTPTDDEIESKTPEEEALLIDSGPVEDEDDPEDELSFSDDDPEDVGVDFVDEDESEKEVAP